MHSSRLVVVISAAACVDARSAAARSSIASESIGEQPPLAAIENPTTQPGYKPVHMPMPAPQPAVLQPELAVAERLARVLQGPARASGRRHPHRHGQPQRQGGDRQRDPAQPRRTRKTPASTHFFGKSKLPLTNSALPSRILTADSSASSDGKGSVNRSEALVTNVAGVVTQVLPNGNLVVEGKQEVRVNFEIRELIVAGIVRPEDIQSDNTIDSTKIAEARIAYGGRGQITDVQQPRYGQQVLDVLLPF